MILLEFGNGIALTDKQIEDCKNKIIDLIKKELPEEAHCISVISTLCKDIVNDMEHKKIYL